MRVLAQTDMEGGVALTGAGCWEVCHRSSRQAGRQAQRRDPDADDPDPS